MKTGKVKWFDAKKGYGFITGEDGMDVFVHQTGIVMEGFRVLYEGQTVIYEVIIYKGKEKAVNVAIVDD